MKVFVLSLHRTGTRSTTDFLQRLGLSTKHCPKLHEGMNYQDVIAGRETDLTFVLETIRPVLDAHEAISDVPLQPLYPLLARAYPDARFVLLTRPAEEWIASVRRHCRDIVLPPFARCQYWAYLEGRPKRLSDASDDQLRSMHARHHEAVLGFFGGSHRLFDAPLHDGDLGRRLASWLGLLRFPHANRSAA